MMISGFLFITVGYVRGNMALLLFALPFDNTLNALPGVSLVKVMLVMTFLSLLLHGKGFVPYVQNKVFQSKAILGLVIVFLAAATLSIDWRMSIVEAYGIIQLVLIISTCWYMTRRMPQIIPWLERVFVIYGVALFMAIFYVHRIDVFYDRLFLARFLGPNTIAVLYFGLAILAYSHWRMKGTVFHFIAFCICVIAVFLSGNRSIPFGLVFALTMVLLVSMQKNRVRLIITIAAPLALLIFIFPTKEDSFLWNARARIFYGFEQVYRSLMNEGWVTTNDNVRATKVQRSSSLETDIRWELYKHTIESTKENPVLGSGPGTSSEVISRFMGYKKSVHSNINYVLLDYGLAGLAYCLFGLIFLFRYALARRQSTASKQFIVILVVFLIDGLAHTNMMDAIVVFFVALSGFKIGAPTVEQASNRVRTLERWGIREYRVRV